MRISALVTIFIGFTLLAEAHVGLITPKGGEVYQPGQIVSISWQIIVNHGQSNWDVQFSSDEGATWVPIVEDLELAVLQYNWMVPNIETSGAMIRIIQDNNSRDYHDDSGLFTIQDVGSSGGALTLSPGELDFESVEIHKIHTRAATLINSGENELIVTEFSIPQNPFSLVIENEPPITLQQGESFEIGIQFETDVAGNYSELLFVTSTSTEITDTLNILAEGVFLTKANESTCYATTGINEGGSLLSINLESGTATKIANINEVALSTAIAINSMLNSYIFNPDDESLYKINAVDGKSVKISPLGVLDVGMDFDQHDVLYYVGLNLPDDRNLYSYNLASDVITMEGSLSHRFTGISFDPISGLLYAITKEGDLYHIDTNDGNSTEIGNTGQLNMTDIAFDPNGNLFGVSGGGKSVNNKLISIDKETGEMIREIGGTGFTAIAGLVIATDVEVLSRFHQVDKLEVFPNPFEKRINIRLHATGQTKAIIYSLSGKLVKQLNFKHEGDDIQSTYWDGLIGDGMEAIPGIYLLVVESGTLHLNKRIYLR